MLDIKKKLRSSPVVIRARSSQQISHNLLSWKLLVSRLVTSSWILGTCSPSPSWGLYVFKIWYEWAFEPDRGFFYDTKLISWNQMKSNGFSNTPYFNGWSAVRFLLCSWVTLPNASHPVRAMLRSYPSQEYPQVQ